MGVQNGSKLDMIGWIFYFRLQFLHNVSCNVCCPHVLCKWVQSRVPAHLLQFCSLLTLSRISFTSRSQNKDKKVEQSLFCLYNSEMSISSVVVHFVHATLEHIFCFHFYYSLMVFYKFCAGQLSLLRLQTKTRR